MENFFTTLINPDRVISPGASRIHGITNADVEDAPRFRQIAKQVQDELEGVVLVAHNAPFDLGFVNNEFRLSRHIPPASLALDTLTLLRRYFRFRSNSLPNVAQALGINPTVSHRALADVLTTREVFQFIINELRPTSLRELLKMQGGTIAWADTSVREEVPLPPALEEALRSRRRLFLKYEDEWGSLTERWVSPVGVSARKEYIYLRAYCHLRAEERSFRLDRVLEMRIEE
jgi:DNA polymerase III epsilon subunit family exonuclease